MSESRQIRATVTIASPIEGTQRRHRIPPACPFPDRRFLARPEGLEPPAYWFEASRSIRLSYGRVELIVAFPPPGARSPGAGLVRNSNPLPGRLEARAGGEIGPMHGAVRARLASRRLAQSLKAARLRR